MKVRDLMTPDVITVGGEASLKEAARRMIEAGISGVVVTDAAGTVEGVITEADFVKAESGRRARKRARLLRWFGQEEEAIPQVERRVSDIMTRDVITVGPTADHAEAARMMTTAGIKRLPVVDREDRLVGIISRSDILRAFARPDADIVTELSEDVMRRILWIDPKRIEIQVLDGNVVLEGRLETKSDADLLEDLAGRLDGVISVQSRLTWEVDNTRLETAHRYQF